MIVYGASGHGLVIMDILLRMGCESVHFVDDADKPHWIGGQVVKPQSTNDFFLNLESKPSRNTRPLQNSKTINQSVIY